MHWQNYGFFGNGSWFVRPIITIILVVLFVYVVSKILSKNKNNTSINSNSALNILNERFARGEIDEEEYNRKKAIITNSKEHY